MAKLHAIAAAMLLCFASRGRTKAFSPRKMTHPTIAVMLRRTPMMRPMIMDELQPAIELHFGPARVFVSDMTITHCTSVLPIGCRGYAHVRCCSDARFDQPWNLYSQCHEQHDESGHNKSSANSINFLEDFYRALPI